MKSAELKLRCGHFNISTGKGFSASDPSQPFLCYTELDTWFAICRPDIGISYDSEICLDNGHLSESIDITVHDAAITACDMSAGTITAELKNSVAEFSLLSARRIIIDLGHGIINLAAKPLISADFCCGSGSMNIRLSKQTRGYFYNVFHGAGTVTINSQSIRRRSSFGDPNGIPVNIRCGLGSVNVSEY